MKETQASDKRSVYEIGYIIIPSVSEGDVVVHVDALKKIITDAQGTIIAEEMPVRERLAYTMRTKTVSGSYHSYDEGYFGWIKFEADNDSVQDIKSSCERHPTVVRMILITTVHESTYLGKRARAEAPFDAKSEPSESKSTPQPEVKKESPVSLEELDKSIDEIVKDAH